jgi:hypothetical protein
MTNFLKGRNRTLKEYAESGKWQNFKWAVLSAE